ncbi:rab11 family-interacting protein 2 [Onthophagus taurus]|uniref:rab11 family-interacting protein 2 n=1 Tax=Onthophagus taurus TaxID=166361 RepID=UPI000C2049AC|nr:rab11 family-interacting protein 2 [Onthophagus taurus]
MWMPTHVQVTVQKAAGLLIKGKNNTNDCFVTIALGKTKFQTSVKEKAEATVEWFEECELPIPDQGNTAEIILTALHRNFLGVDEFLGRVAIPLNTLDIYERPKNRFYSLQSKQGQESKNKDRGKLEVKIAFTVKSGSLTDLSKKEKHKSSIGQLSNVAQSVGGSLLSIGSIEKRKGGLKKFAKSLGSKMHLKGKKKDDDDSSSLGSVGSLRSRNNISEVNQSRQTAEDADPGVVSDDEDFTFDDLSHKSSGSSLNQPPPQNNNVKIKVDSPEEEGSRRHTVAIIPTKPPRNDIKTQDEWDLKLYGNKSKNLLKPNGTESLNRRSWESPTLSLRIEEEDDTDLKRAESEELVPPPQKERESRFSILKPFRKEKSEPDLKKEKLSSERIIIGGENDSVNNHNSSNGRVSNELMQKFEGKSREDLILMVCELQSDVEHGKKKLKDLEDYLDDLLLRVMETTPRLLQNPYIQCKLTQKLG